jgi:hypothetical protein
MKKLFALPVLLAAIVSDAHAAPITISDNFIGGTPTSSAYNGFDVIGDTDKFDIQSLTFSLTGSTLNVQVLSSYFNNVGQYGTQMGDLFISTNGWHPYGSAPYTSDTASNGETWEYALVLSDHGASAAAQQNPTNYTGHSGTVSLYQITNPSQIVLSNASGIYRGNQEVQFNSTGLQALATGSWNIVDLVGGYDSLNLSISLAAFGSVTDWGFHYAMTCGNDVIEGGASVPEPATGALMLTALGGAALLRRRRAV